MLPTQSGNSGFTIDSAEHTIRLERELQASPERVFAAWTDPEQLACWWDAAGEKLAICEMDLRPGGAFRFVTSHHPDKPFTGVYRQIVPPRLLIFDANGAEGRVKLTPEKDGTRMVVEIACRSQEHLAQFMAVGVAAGTSRTLDNLVTFVVRDATQPA